MKVRAWLKQNRHFLLLLYFPVYLLWFSLIEQREVSEYYVIHASLDDVIPFCPVFVIPYLLWFLYVAFAVVYTALRNREEFVRLCVFLFVGMTVFLVISTVFPNIQHLRPGNVATNTLLGKLCSMVYSMDTPTNIFPSIHVYNSLAVHACLIRCGELNRHRAVRVGSLLLCIAIILSTMFLKQHSVCDVMGALILAAFVYPLVYPQRGELQTERVPKRA